MSPDLFFQVNWFTAPDRTKIIDKADKAYQQLTQ